jgi:hypothetical protein
VNDLSFRVEGTCPIRFVVRWQYVPTLIRRCHNPETNLRPTIQKQKNCERFGD